MSAGILQALLLDVGGTLTFDVIEGTPTSPSITLYDRNGTSIGTGTPTISGSRLSYAVSGALCDETSDVYAALWGYTANSVAYKRRTTWAVKARLAFHQLTSARLVSDYYPNLGNRYPAGVSSWDTVIDAAWREYQNWIRSRGLDPHRVMDTAPVEPILAALAASRAAVAYSFGSSQGGDVWQAWADGRRADASRMFTAMLASVGWYDEDESLTPNGGEVSTNLGYLAVSR